MKITILSTEDLNRLIREYNMKPVSCDNLLKLEAYKTMLRQVNDDEN